MSLVEVPAILLLIPLCDSRLGRKYTVLDPPPSRETRPWILVQGLDRLTSYSCVRFPIMG
jgi:hypothetical protein